MRISDWSSDVCSSDLQHVGDLGQLLQVVLRPVRLRADEGAGALAAPDAALRFQHLERAAHRPAADADLLGELTFGRKLPPPFLLELVDAAAQGPPSQAGVAPDRLFFAGPGHPVINKKYVRRT